MNITDHTADMAEALAGNWQKFDSFGWDRASELDDPSNWTIVYTTNRNADLLAQSNASVIAKAMAPFTEGDDPDAVEEHHGHWAVGWVDGYAIRVRRDGNLTPAFVAYAELACAMADYPVLDEADFSEREYEDTLANIQDAGRKFLADSAPDGWESEVYRLLPDREKESRDGHGGYPSEESVKAALAELGYFDEDEE